MYNVHISQSIKGQLRVYTLYMYLEESGLDVFIIHELGEDEELLSQKLVGKVYLSVNTLYYTELHVHRIPVCCVVYMYKP